MDNSHNNKRRILLAISGGIAAYKCADLSSQLMKEGYEVRCILTQNAKEFVSPTVLETLTRYPAHSELFGPGISGTEHIRLARWAELLVFVPATANLISKLTLGLADDLVTTVALASQAPWLVAPAMNTVMWKQPVIQSHVRTLSERGVCFVPPETGTLACGEEGEGRLAALEAIVQAIQEYFRKSPTAETLKNERILITAGPTISPIDAVRYITNHSTGRMGAALAEEALARGAEVHYILGIDKGVIRPTPPPGSENRFHLTEVKSAEEMLKAALKILPHMSGIIAAAAVLDYRVKDSVQKKQKRGTTPITLDLLPSVDVLSELRAHAKKRQWFFGFAAETNQLEKNAHKKMESKKLDYLFANPIAHSGEVLETGFGTPTNGGLLLRRGQKMIRFPVLEKRSLAKALWDQVEKKPQPLHKKPASQDKSL